MECKRQAGSIAWVRALLVCAYSMAAFSTVAFSADVRFSGFATVGYAQSNQDARYLRFIDDGGTFRTDSVAGLQAELQFDRRWSATLQAVGAASRDSDTGAEARIDWAFLSFRPSNDWLLRAGRLRLPFFFHTQNAEVGVTYDQARLPVEVYGMSPIYDFDGFAAAKTLDLGESELQVDAFWGKSDTALRLYDRDPRRPTYVPAKVTARGIVLSHARPGLLLRGGVHQATVDYSPAPIPGLPEPPFATYIPTTPFAPAPPPLGGVLYVPGRHVPEEDVRFLTLGADWTNGPWRVSAEYAWRNVREVQDTGKTQGAYVTVARTIGRWTPYVTYARMLSDSAVRSLWEALNSTPVPLLAQGPPLGVPAGYHRQLADLSSIYDQYSVMLGSSYAFSPTSKLKVEWMRTRVGMKSLLVDGDVRDTTINVFSASWSVAF